MNPDRELPALLSAMLDGQMTAAQESRLAGLLRDDPETQQVYLDFCRTHALLRRELGGYGQLPSVPLEGSGAGVRGPESGIREPQLAESPIAVGAAVELPHPLEAPNCEPLIAPIIIDTTIPIYPPLFSLQSTLGGLLFSYAAATVITGMAILGAWVYKVSYDRQLAESVSPPAAPQSPEPKPEYVGRITGMADCRWAKPDDAPAGSAVPLGHKYTLDSGLMEITYQSGARVILQGPCAYEADSSAGGFLLLGKLTARVETKGEGGRGKAEETVNQKSEIGNQKSPFPLPPSPFIVRTPTAVVTDLGTEFGVEVNGEGHTQTEVFVGKVAVVSVGKATTAGEKRHLVQAGQLARVDGSHVLVTAVGDAGASERRFVRKMASQESQEADSYARMLLALQPVVYYRMEPPADGNRRLVFDSGAKGCHGTFYTSNESNLPRVAGRFGRAIYFGGPGVGDYAFVPNYPKAANDQLTVSAWVLARSRGLWYPVIAANWGSLRQKGQFSLFLCQYDGDLGFYVSQRDGTTAGVHEGASKRLPWDTWQHVAGVVDKSVLRLYRNGVEVASGPCNGLLAAPPMSGLNIGAKKDDRDERANGFFWHGRIDEVAIFNRALSAADIQRLSGRIAERPQEGPSASAGGPALGSHEERRVSTDKK